MRRSTSVWTAGAVVVGLTASVALAQQFADNGPAGLAASDSPRELSEMPLGGPGVESAFAGRDARYLLRNGLDYLNYGEYARALTYLRAVEERQKNKKARDELTDNDRQLLRKGIARAQAGLREPVNSSRSRLAASPARAANRAGGLALATPAGDRNAPTGDPLRDPATRVASAGATTLPDGSPLPPLPDIPPIGADTPKAAAAKVEEARLEEPRPAAAPAPATAAAPAPLDLAEVAAAPVAEAPKAEPRPEPSKDVLTLETVATAPELPAPKPEGPKPPVPIPAGEAPTPVAPAPIPDPAGLAPTSLPEPAPTPLPAMEPKAESAPIAVPAAAPAPEPKPVAPAPLPAEPPALGAPERPELIPAPAPAAAPVAAEAPKPAPTPEPELPQGPAPTPVPAAEPAPSAAPAPAPAPLTAEAPPSSRPEPSRPLPETPPVASEPPPAAEASSLPPLPGDRAAASAEEPRRGASELFTPDRSDYKSLLSPKTREEVMRIAQRQEEEARRIAQQPGQAPAGGPTTPPAMGLGDTSALTNQPGQGSTRFELPRAPSPTEARPLRSIPVPEDFVPLEARQWDPTRKMWAAAAVCHTPLYFQDAVLERYGQSAEQLFGPTGRFLTYPLDDPKQSKQRNQIIQPFFSVGLFAAQIVALPYNMIVDPPWESQYELGYYRPADRIPPDTFYLPLTGVGPPLRGKKY